VSAIAREESSGSKRTNAICAAMRKLAAVKATLAVMESEDVCRKAREAGERLSGRLARLPGVVSVRGAGLLLAAQLRAPVAKEASALALQRGLLVNPVRPDAIRVAPPLLVRDDELDAALRILGDVLGDVCFDKAE